MSAPMKNLFSLVAVAVLAGCATSSTVGQVQEVAPGTYKIGVGHTVRIGHEMENAAVDQAGQYCHAKGQKLLIVPSKESGVVVFRCGEMIQEPTTTNAAPVQLKAQKQQDQTGAAQN